MTKPFAPTLIVIRHAHRGKAQGADADNGLSSKGKDQARALACFFKKRFKGVSPSLYSSPKTRCLQTLAPIAKIAKSPVKTLDCLDESPRMDDLQRKIREFERFRRESGSELTLICSHGDWIPAYLGVKTGIPLELSKGGWAELELASGDGRARLIQGFP